MNRTWVRACVIAEAVGMTAAAGAARASTGLADRKVDHAVALGLALVIAGGLVEGVALGTLQARALADRLGPKGRRRWATVTVAFAGLGWAAASAPAALSPSDGQQPPWDLVLAGAAALGATMGLVLGAGQAWALSGHVPHPGRWLLGSAAGWTVAMPVIFAGATGVGASWHWWLVVPIGTLTGLLAGAALGGVSGPFLETLDGPGGRDRLVLALLEHRRRRPDEEFEGGLVGLHVTGARTGRARRFPVQAARLDHDHLVVLPGRPQRKTWWRNVETRPDVEVLLDGRWLPATGAVLRCGEPGWREARAAYLDRYPSVSTSGEPLVVLHLGQDQGPATTGPAAVGGSRRSSLA